MITLHFNNTTLDIQEEDDSYRYRSLMGEHNLTLKFSLDRYVEIPIGAWCEFMAVRYTLEAPANIKKNGTREIEYTLIMESAQNQLGRYKLRNTVDKRLRFSMCATPKEFLQTIVDNLNMRDSGWSVGECIVSTEKTIPFDHSFINEALQSIADTFETEWEIVGKVIHLRKVEYFKDDPLPLSYGKGNGFVPGVGRSTEADSRPVEILFVQGGSQNIDRSKYGSAELLLPKSQTLVYEGRTYISDAEGYSIRRKNKEIKYNNEDSLDCSEIYPSRVGTVSKVTVVDAANNFYDIIDSSIPENLNYNDYLIEGESMTVIFQSGMLAGDDKAFECKYNHSERKFELVPQEIDGMTMPGDVYIPRVGDTYAVFGCMLPDAYICDNATKTGASWDMFKEAARHMYENEDVKFTFTGELQGLWAKRNWLRVGGRMTVGSYILFSDEQFAPDGISIRITGIKEYLTSPYSPTIELSNSVSGKSVSSTIKEIQNNDVIVEDNQKKIIQYTKRRFRDSIETIEMLEQAMLDNFTNSISPIAVQTMAMLVGDESLQFQFVNSSLNPIAYNVEYNQTTKQLTAPAAILMHMTLGIDTISSSHAKNSYKRWSMTRYVSPVLSDGSRKYYLYAKVPVSGTGSGTFILNEKSIKMTDVSGYYHLLVGILNTEYDGERSFASLYGFTEVLPGQITTNRIATSDGNSFIDFLNNALHLGNANSYLDWNNLVANTLSTINMILENATIKNKLSVLGEALLAGFYFSDEVIKSTAKSGSDPAMYLNGKTAKIHLKSTRTGGDYSLDYGNSEIDLDAINGEVSARNSNGVAYLSASGIFCNNAKTNALPASSGYTHYGSIVGLGFGNVNNNWMFDSESTLIAGVYGRADNVGNAPAYGGYFRDLFAAGLIYNPKYIVDTATNYLDDRYTQVLGLTNINKVATVYLPTGEMEGKVIYAKQVGQGVMRFRARSGQYIFDDISANDYYDIGEGWEAKFTFAKFVLNGMNREAWFISRWRF